MPDFTQSLQANQNISEQQQEQLGKSSAAKMSAEHEQFLNAILKLVDAKEIDVVKPESFLKRDVYDALPEEEQNRVDQSLITMATLLSHIVEFRKSRFTPDESPELA